MAKYKVDPRTPLKGDAVTSFFDFLENQIQELMLFKSNVDSNDYVLLNSCYIFGANTQVTIDTHSFYFRQNLLCQKDMKQGDFTCYFLQNAQDGNSPKRLGFGASGSVYDIEAAFKLSAFEFSSRGYPRQIVKIQNHCVCPSYHKAKQCESHHNSFLMLLREYNFTSYAGHLNIHEPTLLGHTSYTVMDRAPGVDLWMIISPRTALDLTFQQRMELSFALLMAVNFQVTTRGIIHNDLKPENVVVLLESSIQVNVIDYGFASQLVSDDSPPMSSYYRGTQYYTPFEVLNARSKRLLYPETDKIDVFALGRMLVEIWGGREQSYLHKDGYTVNLEYLSTGQCIELATLFKELTEKQQQLLKVLAIEEPMKRLFRSMLDNDYTQRISLDNAIAEFWKIYQHVLRCEQQQALLLKEQQIDEVATTLVALTIERLIAEGQSLQQRVEEITPVIAMSPVVEEVSESTPSLISSGHSFSPTFFSPAVVPAAVPVAVVQPMPIAPESTKEYLKAS